jgi:beta-glucanase (GH16 family)
VVSAWHWQSFNDYAIQDRYIDVPYPLNEGFHTYKLIWQPDYMSTFVDDQLIGTISLAACETQWDCPEFRQHHFLIFNLAVGGAFTCCDYGFAPENDPHGTTYTMEVDYVRIYGNEHTELYVPIRQEQNAQEQKPEDVTTVTTPVPETPRPSTPVPETPRPSPLPTQVATTLTPSPGPSTAQPSNTPSMLTQVPSPGPSAAQPSNMPSMPTQVPSPGPSTAQPSTMLPTSNPVTGAPSQLPTFIPVVTNSPTSSPAIPETDQPTSSADSSSESSETLNPTMDVAGFLNVSNSNSSNPQTESSASTISMNMTQEPTTAGEAIRSDGDFAANPLLGDDNSSAGHSKDWGRLLALLTIPLLLNCFQQT